MGIPCYWIDAFASEAFAGNPAAVCILDRSRPAEWMQGVAAELGLSETAFARREGDGWQLRWFTPRIEVDLCGHATLATSHALWSSGLLAGDESARYHTRSGLLTARRNGPWIELDFPAQPVEEDGGPVGLSAALGVEPILVGRGGGDVVALLEDARTVRELTPDLDALAGIDARGICVTAAGDDGETDLVSRFFAPRVGIAEDPVTGSAHCYLATLWSARLGRTELLARQVSPRGGEVRIRCHGERVTLGGRAVTVLRGELEV